MKRCRFENTNDIVFALKSRPAHWLLATVEVQKDSSTILFECICIICINGKHSFFSFLLCVLIFFHIYANNEDDKSKHHIHNTRHRENILVVVCIYKILLSATFAGIVCSFIYISYHSARSSSREMMSLWRLTIMYITKWKKDNLPETTYVFCAITSILLRLLNYCIVAINAK